MTSIFGAGFAPAYAASKGGIVQLTKSLALAWATDNIQVNAILPGWFDTELTEKAREEIPGLHERVLARIAAGPMGQAGRHGRAPPSGWPATPATTSPASPSRSTAATPRRCEAHRGMAKKREPRIYESSRIKECESCLGRAMRDLRDRTDRRSPEFLPLIRVDSCYSWFLLPESIRDRWSFGNGRPCSLRGLFAVSGLGNDLGRGGGSGVRTTRP